MLPTVGGALVVALLIAVAYAVVVPRGKTSCDDGLQAGALPAGAPAIDREAPATTETATFALG